MREGAPTEVVLSLRRREQRRMLGAHDVTKKQKEMQVLLDFCPVGCIHVAGKQAFPTRLAA